MVKRIVILFCLSLLSFSSLAAKISVDVDRNPVAINESFKIVFKVDDKINGDPDLSPLQKDFKILNRSQNSSVQFINGSLSRHTGIILTVMAKRTGKLTIPSISIGGDKSPVISIEVNETSSGNISSEKRDILIEVETDKNSAYVQQQILYTIRFYRSVNISGASISKPNFSSGEIVAEELGDDSSFEIYREGRRYIVVERKYALFPQQSGDITIDPINLVVQIPGSARDIFDPFGQNVITKQYRSNSITLNVKPIPAGMRNKSWIPASKLELTESWSQQGKEFVVGEPVTRTLTLKAEGLTAAQLPSLAMTEIPGFKAYPDQPELNEENNGYSISGTRQEKIALIPTQTGQLKLPEIKIDWWNTDTNKMETATLPARSVQVKPGISTMPTNQLAATPQPAPVIKDTTAIPQTESITVAREENGLYGKLSILLGLGWLITAIAWLLIARNNKTATSAQTPVNGHPPKASLNAVKKACLENNPQQSKTELLNWARQHWPDNPPASLGEIGQRLNKETQQEIENLNKILYGSASKGWQGNSLWQQLSTATKTVANKQRKREDVLVPLYP